MSNIYEFRSNGLTPFEALNESVDEADDLHNVLIVGIDNDNNLFMRSSSMDRAGAHYLLSQAQLYVLGLK